MLKYFFAIIALQVFLKHRPGHKESIGILDEQIRQWEGSEKSGPTHREAHGHPQIIIWIIRFSKDHMTSIVRNCSVQLLPTHHTQNILPLPSQATSFV